MPLTIEFDRDHGPYKGGDLIVGKVIVINGSEKIKQLSHDLTITFTGKAWTQWKEGRSSKDNLRQYLVSKWEIETYFNQSFLLLQPGNITATRTVEPGVTELPFVYQLPPNLPSSFSSRHGGVTYSAQVLYRRPWKWDKLVQRDIAVVGTYSLNWYPVTTQPGYFTLAKKLWYGMGKIRANLLISKRGFLPGEELHFKLELENDTRLQLSKVGVYLLQITTYFAQSFTRQEVQKFYKIKCPTVPQRQSLNYRGTIFIPDNLPPTNLGNCRIVQPRYSLLLKIKTGIFGKTCLYSVLEGRVPITIGTPEPPITFSRPTILNYHLRHSVANTYASSTTTTPSPYDSTLNGSDTSSNTLLSRNPMRFWNICSYNRDDYDSDPPPSYEDALTLPRVESRSQKYMVSTN